MQLADIKKNNKKKQFQLCLDFLIRGSFGPSKSLLLTKTFINILNIFINITSITLHVPNLAFWWPGLWDIALELQHSTQARRGGEGKGDGRWGEGVRLARGEQRRRGNQKHTALNQQHFLPGRRVVG